MSLSLTTNGDSHLLGTLLAPAWRLRCSLSDDPFCWALAADFLEDGVANRLAQSFPMTSFRIAGGGAPGYRFRYRTLISRSKVIVDDLPLIWRELAEAFTSAEYRRLLGGLVGCETDDLGVHAALCVYERGCWLSPHTDREMRVVTQVVYLNREWDSAWGGSLRLLRSDRMEDVAAEVIPAFNSSVVFRRAQNSWHAVAPLATGVDRSRRSLLLQLTH
jgi:SM-20-related protein